MHLKIQSSPAVGALDSFQDSVCLMGVIFLGCLVPLCLILNLMFFSFFACIIITLDLVYINRLLSF